MSELTLETRVKTVPRGQFQLNVRIVDNQEITDKVFVKDFENTTTGLNEFFDRVASINDLKQVQARKGQNPDPYRTHKFKEYFENFEKLQDRIKQLKVALSGLVSDFESNYVNEQVEKYRISSESGVSIEPIE